MKHRDTVVILAPCYNEEQNIVNFLDSIAINCQASPCNFEVVIVDDGSTDTSLQLLKSYAFNTTHITLTVLQLDFNVGHQQAILQGLLYTKTTTANKIVILDSDGQDDVSLITKMIEMEACDVVHVVRKKREESYFFKFGYAVYKIIFKLITKQSLHFGNFCVINRKILNHITAVGFVHFPSFLSKFASRRKFIAADRKKRESGHSKMSLSDLLNHAIKSLIQYAEELLIVCLWIFIILVIALACFAGFIIYEKLFTNDAVLGWASTIVLGLFNAALIALSAFVIGTQLLKNAYSQNIKFNALVIKHDEQETAP